MFVNCFTVDKAIATCLGNCVLVLTLPASWSHNEDLLSLAIKLMGHRRLLLSYIISFKCIGPVLEIIILTVMPVYKTKITPLH